MILHHPVRETAKKTRTLLWLSRFNYQDQLELQRKATVSEVSKLITTRSHMAWLFENTREMFPWFVSYSQFQSGVLLIQLLDFSVCYSLVAITAGLLQVQRVDCLRNFTRPWWPLGPGKTINVWQPNNIKHCLVSKHAKVEVSGQTVKTSLIKHRWNNLYKPLSKRGTHARFKHFWYAAGQTNKRSPIKHENKRNVLCCWLNVWWPSNFIKHDQTHTNTIKQH